MIWISPWPGFGGTMNMRNNTGLWFQNSGIDFELTWHLIADRG